MIFPASQSLSSPLSISKPTGLGSHRTVYFSAARPEDTFAPHPEPTILCDNSIDKSTVIQDLQKLKALVAFLQPFQEQGNYRNRHFGCRMEATLKETGQALTTTQTNLVLGPSTYTCDLSNALVDLHRQSQGKPFQVQSVYLVNADVDNGLLPTPCPDCQQWLEKGLKAGMLAPDTRILRYYRDPHSKQLTYRSVLLKDFFSDTSTANHTQPKTAVAEGQALSELPLKVSKAAQTLMAKQKIDRAALNAVLGQAQIAYQNNRSDKPEGVAIQFEQNGQYHTQASGRFDITGLRGLHADERALAEGLDQLQPHNPTGPINTRIIAYYGCLPGTKSLGNLARHHINPEKTLLITLNNGMIQAETVADHFPERYQTR